MPVAFEPVVRAVLLEEDVHDDVAEVEQLPVTGAASLPPLHVDPDRPEPLIDGVRDRADVALAAARHDEEGIGQGETTGDVERHQVLRVPRDGGFRRLLHL